VVAGFIQEPRLEFAAGNHHIDIRFGMMNYGPLDSLSGLAPEKIWLGIVGTPDAVEGIHNWIERIGRGVEAKESRYPNLFPRFPGYGHDSNLRAPLVSDPRLHGIVKQRSIDALVSSPERNSVVGEVVNLFISELWRLTEKGSVDVLLCDYPSALLEYLEDEKEAREEADQEADEESEEPERGADLDFHDLLKARAMVLGVPLQVLRPPTYDESKRRHQKRRANRIQRLQDEATRAWNLYTALYYKAGGTPWRLERDPEELTACYVGVSFYEALDRSRLLTSTAQVFSERGDGIVLRGGTAKRSKEDRQVHLSDEDAHRLLDNALRAYRSEHRTLPARLVVHKTSPHNNEELDGFSEALRAHGVDSADFLSPTFKTSTTRLFRSGVYPPLRGTFLTLDLRNHLLYTRGSVDFYRTYPGMYVPRPLLMRCDEVEQTPAFLARESLALTKMNWNNSQFDNSDPITLKAARNVGDILKYIEGDRAQSRYSFYM
jgi:hypothetical protein